MNDPGEGRRAGIAGRLGEYSVLLVLWGVLIYLPLAAVRRSSIDTHSICGPWGCGPPVSALLSVHLGWAAILLPPVFYLPRRLGAYASHSRKLGGVLLAVAITGILAMVAWQLATWYPASDPSVRPYFWNRCGFVIVTAVDWPLAQLTIAGAWLLLTGPAVNGRPRDEVGT